MTDIAMAPEIDKIPVLEETHDPEQPDVERVPLAA